MNILWKDRNEVNHRKTPEEIQQRLRKTINPLVRVAYKTRETVVSLFNQRLFRVDLEKRLSMSPAENTRWLEVIKTATTRKKLREEAVIAATRRMTDIYPTRANTNPAYRPEMRNSQKDKSSRDQTLKERRERE